MTGRNNYYLNFIRIREESDPVKPRKFPVNFKLYTLDAENDEEITSGALGSWDRNLEKWFVDPNTGGHVYVIVGANQTIKFELPSEFLTSDYDIFLLWYNTSNYSTSVLESHLSDSDGGWGYFNNEAIPIDMSDPTGPKAKSINSGTNADSFQRYLSEGSNYHFVVCPYYSSGNYKAFAKPSNSALGKSGFVDNSKINSLSNSELPKKFELYTAYPNPFNPSTTIQYDLPESEYVEIAIFDIKGREIRSLVNAHNQAGQHQVVWDGRNDRGTSVPSGMYFYKITAGEFSETRKMTLLK